MESLHLLVRFILLPLTFACLASYNPDVTTTTMTTTTTLPCPCTLPSTDTSPECNLPIFGMKAGTPTLRIQGSNDPNNPCTGFMTGCTSYRIVNQNGCNNPVQMFPITDELQLICNGGPNFLAPSDPILKVDCATV